MTARLCRNILLAFYVLIALAWSVAVPTFEAPDAQEHMEYVVFLAREGRLPVLLRPQPEVVGEGFQPPLYYSLMAVLWGVTNDASQPEWISVRPDWDPTVRKQVKFLHGAEERFPFAGVARRVHVLRVVSVLIGLLGLWTLHRALTAVFPDPSVVPCVALAWAGFVPGFVFNSVMITNDVLAAAIGAIVVNQTVTMLHTDCSWRSWTWLGVLTGAGVLSKLSVLPVAAACAVGLVWFLRRRPSRVAVGLGCFCAAIAIICGWWLWRNVQLYGHPLAYPKIYPVLLPVAVRPAGWWNWERVWTTIWEVFQHYWGMFGDKSVVMGQWVYRLLAVATMFWVMGAAWCVQKRWSAWPVTTRKGVCIIIAATVANLAAVACFNIPYAAAEARHTHPGYTGHALLVALAMVSFGNFATRRPLRNVRLVCSVAGLLCATLWVFQGPLLGIVETWISRWITWRPRAMTLDYYLAEGRWLYKAGMTWLVIVALVAGALWAAQARKTRAIGEEALGHWWRERRFELALGGGILAAAFNVFCLVKFLLPAYR